MVSPPDPALAALRQLQLVGRLEGASFLLLLLVAMPLKYLGGVPEATRVAGAIHGLLFLWYLSALARAASERRWPASRILLGFLAAVIPLAVFAFDGSLRREARALAGG